MVSHWYLPYGSDSKAFCLFFLSSSQSLKSKDWQPHLQSKAHHKRSPVDFSFFTFHHSSKYFLWSVMIFYSLNIHLIFHLFGGIFILDPRMCSESVYQLQLPMHIYLVLLVLTQPILAHTCWLPSCLEKPEVDLTIMRIPYPCQERPFGVLPTFPFFRHLNSAGIWQHRKEGRDWTASLSLLPYVFT